MFEMIHKNFRSRLASPTLTVFTIALISFTVYFGSRHVDNDFIHQSLAAIFGTTYFLSIAFGALFIYTTAYLRGASLHERILSCFIVPFMWMSKEVLRLTESHPLVECLYYYFNPLNLWLVSLIVMEMGAATLLARFILRRRGETVQDSPTGPLLAIIISIFFFVSLYAWGQGENVYVYFLKGYRLLFGSGT